MYFVISSILMLIGGYFGIVGAEQYAGVSTDQWVGFRTIVFYAIFIIGVGIAAVGALRGKE